MDTGNGKRQGSDEFAETIDLGDLTLHEFAQEDVQGDSHTQRSQTVVECLCFTIKIYANICSPIIHR